MEELKEFNKDRIRLCREIGKFLNKWRGRIFKSGKMPKPLELTLVTLEHWLGSVEPPIEPSLTLRDLTELKEAYRNFQRAETDEEYDDAYEKFLRVCEKTLR